MAGGGAYSITEFIPQLPKSLKKIGAGAFAHHTSWDADKPMKISGTIELRGVESMEGSAFYRLPYVTAYVIGDKITSLSTGGTSVDSMKTDKGPLEENAALRSITWLGGAPTTFAANLWVSSASGSAITNYVYQDFIESWNALPNCTQTSTTIEGTDVYAQWKLTSATAVNAYAARLPGHPASETQPIFAFNPSVELTETGFQVSASLSQGSAQLFAVFRGTDGSEVTNAVTQAEVTGDDDAWYTVPVTGLTADRTYTFGVFASNADGETAYRDGIGTFFNGAVSVTPPSETISEDGGSGTFTFTRTGTDGDLVVALSSTGTAEEFVNFREIPKTVTIPDGASSASLTLEGVVDLLTDSRTAQLSIASGLYFIADSAGTASVGITDYVTPADSDFASRLVYTASGYAGSAPVERFPVLVRIPQGKVSDFTKIAFFDSEGTYLAFDVDTVNAEGESLVWVSVPLLSKTETVTLVWNPTGTYTAPASLKYEVWRDANYVAVWHLGETADAISGSTVYGINGTRAGGVSDCPAGAVGAAQTIATTGSGKPYIAFPKFNRYYVNSSDFTFSAWINHAEAVPGNNETVVSTKNSEGDNYGVTSLGFQIVSWGSTADNDNYCVWGNSSYDSWRPGDSDKMPASSRQTWSHLVADYRPAGGSVCSFNGQKVWTKNVATIIPSELEFTLGNNANHNGYRYVGSMDEVRIRNGESSTDWVKAEYDTVNNADFLTRPATRRGAMFMIY